MEIVNKVLARCPDNARLERLELACLASGQAGLRSMHQRPTLQEPLANFYAERLQAWLNRELSDYAPQVLVQGNRYTMRFADPQPVEPDVKGQTELPGNASSARERRPAVPRKAHLRQAQLRLVPSLCRWLLFTKLSGQWHPYLPQHQCLAFTDWLCQVRRLVTRGT